jgi:hypothetical protein
MKNPVVICWGQVKFYAVLTGVNFTLAQFATGGRIDPPNRPSAGGQVHAQFLPGGAPEQLHDTMTGRFGEHVRSGACGQLLHQIGRHLALRNSWPETPWAMSTKS